MGSDRILQVLRALLLRTTIEVTSNWYSFLDSLKKYRQQNIVMSASLAQYTVYTVLLTKHTRTVYTQLRALRLVFDL